jgi:cytochrome c
MKKAFILFSSGMLLLATISSCGGNNSDAGAKKETETAVVPEEPMEDPAIQEGLALIGQSDCLTCHKVNEKLIGPAYTAVSERYKDNPVGRDSLSHKIIKGGAGNWGQVAMTPHPNISEEEAKKMVTYIMSLKPE